MFETKCTLEHFVYLLCQVSHNGDHLNCLCYTEANMKQRKQKKYEFKNRKVAFYLAGLLVLAILMFQAFVDVSVFRSVIQARPDYGAIVTSLISEAAQELNKPAPIEPTTGKEYIPEARLVLPAYTGFGQIEYMYEAGQRTSNFETEVHLTSSAILNAAENKVRVDDANANNRMAWQSYDTTAIFNSIPSLQACTRGVQIFFSKQALGANFVFQDSHKLIDGRTLYVYSESACKQDQSAVIDLAKQAQSY